MLSKAQIKDLGVAPLVGAWIEMYVRRYMLLVMLSLLSWERGLKFGTE